MNLNFYFPITNCFVFTKLTFGNDNYVLYVLTVFSVSIKVEWKGGVFFEAWYGVREEIL